MAAPAPPRVNAPVKRFSSTERCAKQWRPSMTWMQPRREEAVGPPPARCDRSQPASVGHETPGGKLLFGRVLGRRLLDHRRDDGIVGRDPIRRDIPFLAVPGLDAAHSRAFMVLAGDLERLQLVFEAELLQPFCSQVEVFEAPPNLLTGQR